MTKDYWREAPTEELVTEVMNHLDGMPVRALEALVPRGASAVELLRFTVRTWVEVGRPALAHWSVVGLGVARDAAAIPELVPLLGTAARGGRIGLGFATAEAVGRMGAEAEPALLMSAERTPRHHRLWHYYTATLIRTDRTYAFLLDELESNPQLADVIALALADRRSIEAMPALGRALRRLRPWQRGALEMAVRALHHGTQVLAPYSCDWRLRYRFVPGYGAFPPLWPCIAAIIRSGKSYRCMAGDIRPHRTLDELLSLPPAEPPPLACTRCGAPARWRTGVAACDRCAPDIAHLQSERLLDSAQPFSPEDLFDVLDWLDIFLGRAEDDARHGRHAKSELRTRYAEGVLARAGCHWLIGQGIETTAAGAATLLVEGEDC